MGSDPEPDQNVSVLDGKGAITDADSSGEDGSRRMNTLELQTRVRRIVEEQFVRLSRLALNVLG